MWKRIVLCLLCLALLLGGGAIVAVRYQRAPQVLTVQDDTGVELVFSQLPRRIVVLNSMAAQLLAAWDLSHLVVGAGVEQAAFFPRVENLGAAQQIAPQQIVALRTDLVIVGAQDMQLVEQLRAAGLSVFAIGSQRLTNIMNAPRALAVLTAQEQAVDEWITQQAAALAAFQEESRAAIPSDTRILWWRDENYTVAGLNTMEDDLVQLVGGVNAAAHLAGAVDLTLAEAQALAPAIIIAPESLLPEIERAFAPAAWSQQEVSVPRLVALPADFDVIDAGNVLAKAEWLRDTLLSSADAAP